MRTLTITAAEVPVILAAIQSGEHVWLVREGEQCSCPPESLCELAVQP